MPSSIVSNGNCSRFADISYSTARARFQRARHAQFVGIRGVYTRIVRDRETHTNRCTVGKILQRVRLCARMANVNCKQLPANDKRKVEVKITTFARQSHRQVIPQADRDPLSAGNTFFGNVECRVFIFSNTLYVVRNTRRFTNISFADIRCFDIAQSPVSCVSGAPRYFIRECRARVLKSKRVQIQFSLHNRTPSSSPYTLDPTFQPVRNLVEPFETGHCFGDHILV